ncbi:glycosyltransferase family 4 protein [Methylobacterium nigriterrae]|uniref:glycosyltransferase family 4 protein n=1 Tax=Methylobacterium nigriterrae TaxID=3127512 RepID=UPI0030140827
MRILLPTLYATHGGSTRVLLAAAGALRAEHAVTVRAPIAEADDPAPSLFPSRPLVGPWRKLAALPPLGRLLRSETAALRRLRPDLIYVHDEPALYLYGFAARGLRPRPRVLWHLHAEPGSGLAGRVRAALADACIAISPHVAVPRGLPSRLIRNPLALPPDLPAVAAPNLAGLAVVGAISPRKGQDLAVEALAHLRRAQAGETAHLTLIGPELDPPFAGRLRARIAALGLDGAVTFAGERPAEEAFANVGLAIFPSSAETQPLALAEALARGLPVAASDIPAHGAMLTDAGADPAMLCPREPEAFARTILRVAGRPRDPELPARIRALYAPDRFERDIRSSVSELVQARGTSSRL